MNRRQALFSLAAFGASSFFKPSSLLSFNTEKTSLRYAVMGDWGVGDRGQYDIAKKMFETHQSTPIDFILTVGDNIYPDGKAEHFVKKFEKPFDGLIKAKVPFYAALGNHDVQDGREAQLDYPLFNMNGESYYKLSKGDGLADFFMLDTTEFDDKQKFWLESSLRSSNAKWKLALFHHPLYSSGKRHGSDDELKQVLEPILVQHGVKIVFSGHDHFYERLNLQKGIQYFVTGAAGALRRDGLHSRSTIKAECYDKDNHFMLVELNEDEVSFKAISRRGDTVDKGIIQKVPAPAVTSAGA
jgi:predicted MPP superfamily phosphohydrolase